MKPKGFLDLCKIWDSLSKEPSGNFTSNTPISSEIRKRFFNLRNFNLTELEKKLDFIPIKFESLGFPLSKIKGLEILSWLQKLYRPKCITFFRAIRFPSPKRLIELSANKGLSIINYEHVRLRKIYEDEKYIRKRKSLQKDLRFSFIPQERIVKGLPVFILANDAIQIHRAFRNIIDKIVLVVAFVPVQLIEKGTIKLFSNQSIVENYYDRKGDKRISHFEFNQNGYVTPRFRTLRLEGIDLSESYLTGISWNIEDCKKIGVEQKFYILDIYKIRININKRMINSIKIPSKLLRHYSYFLYGFWGDDYIFGRRASNSLPFMCNEVVKRNA